MEMSMRALLASLVLIPAAALAGDDGGPHRGPPPGAVAACTSKAAGEVCTLAFGDRTVNGVCRATHDGQTMACRPPPPQAAIDACAGHAANDSCQMSFPDGRSAAGTCRAAPDGDEALACRPAHHPGQPGGAHR
jgi:hypothetical protein